MSHWSDKHNRFCTQHRFSASVRALWQWLVEQFGEGLEVEFDLKEFNSWVEKERGQGYDPKTLKIAAQKLVDCGAVKDLVPNRFKWNWKRLIIRSINLLIDPIKPKLKNSEFSQKLEQDSDLNASNSEDSWGGSLAAAYSNNTDTQILDTCEQAGIEFRKEEAGNLLQNSIENVRRAISHFQKRGGHSRIENPQGWLIECLRRQWWKDDQKDDEYYSANNSAAKKRLQDWQNSGCPLGG